MASSPDASLHRDALALHHAGEFAQAEAIYRQLLDQNPQNADAWRNLGLMYYTLERYAEAKTAIQTALGLDRTSALSHYSLGLVLGRSGAVVLAIQSYQRALALDPNLIDAINAWAGLCEDQGQADQAAALYRRAIAVDASHVGSYLNLGNTLLQQGQISAAIATYRQALALQPSNPDIFYNLGVAYEYQAEAQKAAFCYGYAAFYQKNYGEAVAYLGQLMGTDSVTIQIYSDVAVCHRLLNQLDSAIQTYRQGLHYYPTSHQLYTEYLRTLQFFQQDQQALELAEEASRALPDELTFQLHQSLFLPILYTNEAEIYRWRQRFTDGIASLSQVSLETADRRQNALRALHHNLNVYLQYQNQNDLALQQGYGTFVQQVMARSYPEWTQPRSMPPLTEDGKIRIAYVSEGFSHSLIGRLLLGCYRYADQQRFQLYSYSLSHYADQITQHYRLYSTAFYPLSNRIEEVCQQILADQPHIIVYPALGLYAPLTQLAGLRLAPVQCTTWLHPTTSGLPTIDYFLSSDIMEPDQAQDHYSETLIRLPNLGLPYPCPEDTPSVQQRSDFNLPDATLLYLSCQSLQKYLPQHDYIYAEIARRMPQAKLVFVTHASATITQDFQHRLSQAFAQVNLVMGDHCLFLPRLSRNYYLDLLHCCDVFLDSFGWTGGVTTAEAIACGLPIVTLPGALMRGRQSSGMLTLIGMTETIARDAQDYIDIAVRLGTETSWRMALKTRLGQQRHHLYDDRVSMAALERFYEQVVMTALNRGQ